MTADEFVASADAAAPSLSAAGTRSARASSVRSRRRPHAVGANTNLGIILLCAPLAAAADGRNSGSAHCPRQSAPSLDIEDAGSRFAPSYGLRPLGSAAARAMMCSNRRRSVCCKRWPRPRTATAIARQYVDRLCRRLRLGLRMLRCAARRHADPKWATLATYLGFLSAFPDRHILRKYGAHTAEQGSANRGGALRNRSRRRASGQFLPELLAWDAELKAASLNPGTSADLTVATFRASTVDRLAVEAQQ